MNRIKILLRTSFLVTVGLFFYSVAFAQSQQDNYALLQILPAITFMLALVTGVLNLYIMNKLSKTKEEILTIVRLEFKTELHGLEARMATKEQIEFVRTEMGLMFKNIETKIDNRNTDGHH